jgi:hypothetical protein
MSSARCSKTSAACASGAQRLARVGGARTSVRSPGVASSLVEYGIRAVVGMRFEISDEAAIMLAGRLYSAIAQGFPIGAAMAAVASDAQAVVTLNRNQTPTTATAAQTRCSHQLSIDPVSPTRPLISVFSRTLREGRRVIGRREGGEWSVHGGRAFLEACRDEGLRLERRADVAAMLRTRR